MRIIRCGGRTGALAAAAFVLLIQLHSAAAAFIDLPLEHAFGSSDFSQAGTLKGDLDGQGFGGLELQRSAWSDADRQRFQQLAREDGFYRLRLQPGGGTGGHVLTSLRARCLVASDFEERLTVHTGSDASITGLEYDTANGSGCPPGLPLAEGQLQGLAPGTAPLAVAAVQPASAPRILLEPYMNAAQAAAGLNTPGAATGLLGGQPLQPGQQPGQQQQQQGQAAAAAAARKGKDGKPVPPVDERTWIQKNWLFLIPVGLMIFNTLGGFAAPQAGGGSGS